MSCISTGKIHQHPFSLSGNRSSVPLNYYFPMFGELPLIYQIMIHVIMLFLLIISVNLLGYILSPANLMSFFQIFRSFKLTLNTSLIVRSNPSNWFVWRIPKITPPFYISLNPPFEYVSPHPSAKWVFGAQTPPPCRNRPPTPNPFLYSPY